MLRFFLKKGSQSEYSIDDLLKAVVDHNEELVKNILQSKPKLLLATGEVTDRAGRAFENITAYDYAYWAQDRSMCQVINDYLQSLDRRKQGRFISPHLLQNGLLYTQNDIKTNSKHFSLAAFQEYFDAVKQPHLLSMGEEIVDLLLSLELTQACLVKTKKENTSDSIPLLINKLKAAQEQYYIALSDSTIQNNIRQYTSMLDDIPQLIILVVEEALSHKTKEHECHMISACQNYIVKYKAKQEKLYQSALSKLDAIKADLPAHAIEKYDELIRDIASIGHRAPHHDRLAHIKSVVDRCANLFSTPKAEGVSFAFEDNLAGLLEQKGPR